MPSKHDTCRALPSVERPIWTDEQERWLDAVSGGKWHSSDVIAIEQPSGHHRWLHFAWCSSAGERFLKRQWVMDDCVDIDQVARHQTLAAAHQIANPPLAWNADLGLYVEPLLPIVNRQPLATQDHQVLDHLANCLARLHRATATSWQAAQDIPRIWQQRLSSVESDKNEQAQWLRRHQLVINQWHQYPPRSYFPPALCHMDAAFYHLYLNSAGAPQLLDWEYSLWAPVGLDLHACISINQLTNDQRQKLLERYASYRHCDWKQVEQELRLTAPFWEFTLALWCLQFDQYSV